VQKIYKNTIKKFLLHWSLTFFEFSSSLLWEYGRDCFTTIKALSHVYTMTLKCHLSSQRLKTCRQFSQWKLNKQDVRTKSRNWSLSPCPHWPHPPCPCGHTTNFKKSEFFAPKSVDIHIWRISLPRLSAMENPPPSSWLRTSFMDSPLF